MSTKCKPNIIVVTCFRFFTYNNIVKMVRDMVPGGYVKLKSFPFIQVVKLEFMNIMDTDIFFTSNVKSASVTSPEMSQKNVLSYFFHSV